MAIKKRKDCFFGVHFDFHSNPTAQGIGERLDGEEIRAFIREVQPDFLQCDVKGHGGYSSYPTKCGYPTPNMKKDILRIFRDITAQEGVALYAHYSGVLDAVQAEIHPNWRVVNKDGSKAPWSMSFFSEYDEEILISQLKELALDYKLDGAWVDGECWASAEDYSPQALQAYEDSGKTLSFKDFHRQAFRNHVTNYIQKVKAVAPNFEITSNWMYTEQLPEKPSVPVDFVSGDMIPRETYDASKFGSRVIANQHMVWDLISWSTDFYMHYEKSALQLCVEATDIIAMGGAYQVYCAQDYKGFMQNETYVSTLKEVAKFCRAREEYCHKANIRKEVGVLISEKGYFHERAGLFGRGGIHTESAKGCVVACLENQYSTEILLGYNALEQDISAYKAIVVPELKDIEPALKEKLLAYAKSGGMLVVIGAYATALFADMVGVKPVNEVMQDGLFQLVIDGKKVTVECACLPFETQGLHQAYLAETTADGLGVKQSMFGNAGGGWPLPRVQFTREVAGSIVREYGKGKIALVPFDLGEQYLNTRTYQMRDFLAEVLKTGYEKQSVITNTHLVEVILSEKDNREFVQLINLSAGRKAFEIKTYDEVLPLRGLQVEYARGCTPKKVMQYPESKEVPFAYKNGRVCFTLDELPIHTIVEMID